MDAEVVRTRGPRDICERTFAFAVGIVRLCSELDQRGGVARVMGRQLLRSGTSIGANVEEAQAAQSGPDFISKTTIALKESRETCYWLRLLAASSLVPEEHVSHIRDEAEQISRIIASIIVNTQRPR